MIWMMMVVVLVAVPHWLNMKAKFVFRKASFSISTTRIFYGRIIIDYKIYAHKLCWSFNHMLFPK